MTSAVICCAIGFALGLLRPKVAVLIPVFLGLVGIAAYGVAAEPGAGPLLQLLLNCVAVEFAWLAAISLRLAITPIAVRQVRRAKPEVAAISH